MKCKVSILIILASVCASLTSCTFNKTHAQLGEFDIKKDLLLANFDCKTDVDDLHTIAGFMTLLSDANFSGVKYHAVAGTYGMQEGLYVPPNDLFQLAFGKNWTDAHNNSKAAVLKVQELVKKILNDKGDIWIAEAGQSDFTAGLIAAIQTDLPEIKTSKRIHVIQHSDWNEKETTPARLDFVKNNSDYKKIADGNAVGNGTPGFNDAAYTTWDKKVKNPKLKEIWKLATDLSDKYNGKDGRYKNAAIAAGGLDFSDLSEVCWILGIQDIQDTTQFFNQYVNK